MGANKFFCFYNGFYNGKDQTFSQFFLLFPKELSHYIGQFSIAISPLSAVSPIGNPATDFSQACLLEKKDDGWKLVGL